MTTVIQQLRVFLNEVEGLKSEYRQYLVDKTIPLEIRWRDFTSLPQLHHTATHYVNLPGVGVDWYGQLFIDHERVNLVEFIGHVEAGVYDKSFPGWKPKCDEAKEYLLAHNYGAFVHDWCNPHD